jgi:hypothetical protein
VSQQGEAAVADHLVFDRVWVHGNAQTLQEESC